MTHSEDHLPIAPSAPADASAPAALPQLPAGKKREVGGREGPDPTRFGDWELRGRCIDF